MGDLAALIRPYLSLDHLREGYLASFQLLFVVSKALFVGTTVVGAVAAVVTYFVALGAVRELRLIAFSHRAGFGKLPSHEVERLG